MAAPSESLIAKNADMQALNKFDGEQIQQLSSIVFAFLVDQSKSSQLMERLTQFAELHGINESTLKNVVKSLLVVLKNGLRKNVDAKQLKEDLKATGVAEDKATVLSEQWNSSQATLSQGQQPQTLMVNQLVDMEWKFGVTAASSELNKVGNTFLQMKLAINKGHAIENVYMELTLSQFYSFLHEMEKAKSSLEFLS